MDCLCIVEVCVSVCLYRQIIKKFPSVCIERGGWRVREERNNKKVCVYIFYGLISNLIGNETNNLSISLKFLSVSQIAFVFVHLIQELNHYKLSLGKFLLF